MDSHITFDIVKEEIMLRHLEQLQQFRLIDMPRAPGPGSPPWPTYDKLVGWTKDSKKQIETGVANRVFGGPTGSQIDFNNAFMAFLESTAMYLRNTSLVTKAVDKYRLGDVPEALRLLEKSVEQINLLADSWGLKFVMICDLVDEHPVGHPILVGPFCGAFMPKDLSEKPFVGVAFKGTNTTLEALVNDIRGAITTRAPEKELFGGQISEGFYYPVFSKYKEKPTPFVLVKKAIEGVSVTVNDTKIITHVTGHSLGAAYGALCYAQLILDPTDQAKTPLGDLYTFGCPRVGRGDFAKPLKDAIKGPLGSSWRVANDKDFVTMIPVTPLLAAVVTDPFIHIDALYNIYADKKPAAGASEIGTDPPIFPQPPSLLAHIPDRYYDSLKYATPGTLESPVVGGCPPLEKSSAPEMQPYL